MRRGRQWRLAAWTVLLAVAATAAPAAARSANPKSDVENYQAWRAFAAATLSSRSDAGSLATAAALTFAGPVTRTRAETSRAAAAALDLAIKATDAAPEKVSLSWLRLQLCASALVCDVRDAATTMRWVDADNGAAWMPTLAAAQRDRDTVEIDRVLADMALGQRFDLYTNRTAVIFYDALRRVQRQLPARYLPTDLARLNEAVGIADAETIPSFSPLINACRDPAGPDRRDACLRLAKVMQHGDTVMAQLVGFAIARRFAPADGREFRTLAERRRTLEWRVATANDADARVLPWVKNARARARVAKMRAMPREEDMYTAVLREHRLALEPPEEHR